MRFSPHTMHNNATRRHTRQCYKSLLRYRPIVLVTGGESSSCKLAQRLHSRGWTSYLILFPPGERPRTVATQRRTEGEAGSPFQADREDTAGLTPVHAYYSTQWIYHELREMTSPQFP